MRNFIRHALIGLLALFLFLAARSADATNLERWLDSYKVSHGQSRRLLTTGEREQFLQSYLRLEPAHRKFVEHLAGVEHAEMRRELGRYLLSPGNALAEPKSFGAERVHDRVYEDWIYLLVTSPDARRRIPVSVLEEANSGSVGSALLGLGCSRHPARTPTRFPAPRSL